MHAIDADLIQHINDYIWTITCTLMINKVQIYFKKGQMFDSYKQKQCSKMSWQQLTSDVLIIDDNKKNDLFLEFFD